MPDRRAHRGPHPQDAQLFAEAALSTLQQATGDLSWLFSRGYSADAALKLVGDRYQLQARQRLAIARCACSDEALASRNANEVAVDDITGRELLIDGYNLLTTIEAALAGAVIIVGRDGSYRDMASMHGTYRKVEETLPAIELIGRALAERSIASAKWLLDKPVSNSGRLAAILREAAESQGWNWEVELVLNPDAVMISASDDRLNISADSVILDRGASWCNLARHLVQRHVSSAWVVDFGGGSGSFSYRM